MMYHDANPALSLDEARVMLEYIFCIELQNSANHYKIEFLTPLCLQYQLFRLLYFTSSDLDTMAPQFEDLRKTAFNAEKDLNTHQAKQGAGKKSDSSAFYSQCYVISHLY